MRFDGDHLPVWHEESGRSLDPETGELLPSWDEALDEIGPHDVPRHVARFGARFDAQGVLAGSKAAARCIGYLTKYVVGVAEVLDDAVPPVILANQPWDTRRHRPLSMAARRSQR